MYIYLNGGYVEKMVAKYSPYSFLVRQGETKGINPRIFVRESIKNVDLFWKKSNTDFPTDITKDNVYRDTHKHK